MKHPQNESSDTNAAIQPPTSTTENPRVLVGLVAGRIVNYSMLNGAVRPLHIVNAFDGTGLVDGVLMFDGIHDKNNHVRPLVAGRSGHLPSCVVLLLAVEFSHTPEVGKWHWPEKQAVHASSVDANAITTQMVGAVQEEFGKNAAILTQRVLDLVNEKMEAHLKTVNELLDTVTEPLADLAEPGAIVEVGGDPAENSEKCENIAVDPDTSNGSQTAS